ncbi:MAG TPA: DHA2 family efflux MFS transporter permease subunit [Solirubrobacteraceae bacterium]|nr:DHA2 family efflux MFS transporter permease subunit [Solirubrobacteraceae bacterium]
MTVQKLAKQRHPGWVLGLTSLSFFMCVLDSLVVITALPRMQQDLRVGLATLQWTVNAYGIAFAAGIITAAALGDRFGRRRVFTYGLAVFTTASAACALAPDASLLIVARALQGLGGAAVLPLSLTILTNAFPVEKRGAIVGVYGGLAGLAVASGPLIGGALTQGLDWHWIFWANVPLGAFAVLLAPRLLPESHGAAARLDLPGVALVSAAVVGLVWGLVRANDVGWTSAEILGSLVGGALLLGAFFAWERRASAPLVPLGMLRVPAFVAGNATAFLMSGAIFGGAFMVTEYFQFTLGYSPLATGVRLLPFTMTPIFIAPLAGALSDRLGRRPLIVTGLALQAIGFAWVALIGTPGASLLELLLALFVAGAGTSMALPTVPTAVLSSVPAAEMGKASGINNMMQRFGGVFAVAIESAVLTSYAHAGTAANVAVTDGFRPAVVVSAVLALLGALSAIALSKRSETAAAREAAAELIAA